MLQRYVQVFSSDPGLVSYLTRYLHARSCNVIEEEGKFYLRSSYFENLSVLPDGLGAVLELVTPAFSMLSTQMQVEQCIQALLLVLNGIINLKYKSGGLQRVKNETPPMIEHGVDYSVDSFGQRVYTAKRSIQNIRVVVRTSSNYFRTADEQKPSTKKIWNIARSNASVAR